MSLGDFLSRHAEVVQARLTRVRGSAPREEGATMLIGAASCHGTIGGGQLEFRTIAAAREMLETGEMTRETDIPLGPDTGQCCGGRVRLHLRRMTGEDRAAMRAAAEAEAAARPLACILGAGHVGRALARHLTLLPLRTLIIDSREAELALCPEGVARRLTALPEAEIDRAPPGSAFVVLTHDHGLDFLLAARALARGDAAYVGMIGSTTKRARFERWCRDTAGQEGGTLVCPIGAGTQGDKRPEVIAALTAAEMLGALLRHRARIPAATEAAP